MNEHYDSEGRLGDHDIWRNVPDFDAEYFLCGPAPFLSELAQTLSERGVPDAQVHIEQF